MRSAQSSLRVDVRDEQSLVTVRLDGELDVTSSPLLQTVIDQVLTGRRRTACRHLVLDMSGVSFADASGLSPILLARALLARRQGHLELRHCRRCVLRVLRVLGLEDLLPAEGEPTIR